MFGRNRKRWFCHEFIEINWSKILWVKEIRKLSKKKKTNVYKFEPQKNKNGGKKVFSINERLARMLIAFFVVFIILVGRLGWLQIVQGADLREDMYRQLTASKTISPKRGTIYDSTGKALAISAQVDTVSIDPTRIVVDNEDEKIAEAMTKQLKEKVAKAFSDIFDLDYEETLEKVSSDSTNVTIAKKVENDKIEELKAWMEENDIYSGINIDEDTKRYYPYDNLASSLIGFCGTDNQGLYGLELKWNDILTGTPGKVTSAQDAVQDLIPYENETYIAPQNGNDVTLTIDANIQQIAEKYLKQACEENDCKDGGNVIIMNPNNGDILAMATYPDYNLNSPFTLDYVSDKEWDKMSDEEKNTMLQETWNNRAITSTYEPGSVFKIITAAAGLEEGLADADTPNVFQCEGYEKISGVRINCSDRAGHGSQSLRDALKNSCNPAFMQLGEKIGAATLYRYYDAFGFFDTTGFADIGDSGSSGERSGYFWDLDDVGPIELATMSFGQRFRVTPLQMITAVSAIANDGVLVQPRIAKEIKNTDTGAVTTIEPKNVRQVVSKETSETLLDMLETVVDSGTGKYAEVKGYSIAGKTGTSEPDESDPEEKYVASFAAISPVESPEVVVLVTLYGPQGESHSGSTVAAPVVSQILSEVLPYLGIQSDTTDSESSAETTALSNVKNKTMAEAKKIIEKQGFECIISGNDDDIVTEQMPAAGTALIEDSVVRLYSEDNDTRVSQSVPNLKGMSLSEAKAALKNKNLNIKYSGEGKVTSQDITAGTSVEEGTVVNVVLKEEIEE